MVFYQLLATLMLIHNAAGVLGEMVKSSIVGGHSVVRGAWPWMVHLNISADRVVKFRCGGTLLNQEWVLTSAGCLDRNPPPTAKASMAWLGTHDLQDSSAMYLGIKYFVVNPKYERWNGGCKHDIALVRLKRKVNFMKGVQPVKLPSSSDTFGPSSECFITGWGNTGVDVPLPDPETLQQLRVSVVPQTECEAKYPGLTADMLCAGDAVGGGDACYGDYGGPLVCRRPRGFVQAGIISFGRCSTRDRPGVYTRVSQYLDFINSYIHQGSDEDGAPDEP